MNEGIIWWAEHEMGRIQTHENRLVKRLLRETIDS